MSIIQVLKTASEQSPVFVKTNLYEAPRRYRTSSEEPYAVDVILAVVDVVEEDYEVYIHTDVVDPGRSIYTPSYCHHPKFGDYYNMDADDFDGVVIASSEELRSAYNRFVDLHKSAPYRATGRLYHEHATYHSWDKDHKYPVYSAIEGSERVWSLKDETLLDGRKVDSLETAEIWMVENHPEYLQGMSIYQEVTSGNFSLHSVPGSEYPEGMYETFEARMRYARDRAARLGTQVRQ